MERNTVHARVVACHRAYANKSSLEQKNHHNKKAIAFTEFVGAWKGDMTGTGISLHTP